MDGMDFVLVHPHVRGEQLVRHGEKLLTLGSSPRAWGTVTESTHGVDKVRFIPTCVGNRFSMEHIYTLSPVHPHVRGEQTSHYSLRQKELEDGGVSTGFSPLTTSFSYVVKEPSF